MARKAVLGALAVLCTACLAIPHTHVKRPAATFRVRDASHRPVSGALIALDKAIIVGRVYEPDTNVVTNDSGVARTTRRREWHWFYFLLPDGEAPWVWKWRVDAPGYKPDSGRLDREPRDTVRITLERP